MARLAFRPVTQATKDDFTAVFEGPGGPKYCWCMAFRATRDELKDTKSPARRRQMLGRIDAGTPVGLVGYLDGKPVAWVSVAPKDTFHGLGGPEPRDGEVVWSLTCMYVRRALRGAGHAHELIGAAAAHARARGATVLEAYPVDPDSRATASWASCRPSRLPASARSSGWEPAATPCG